jgi:tetratricopeptide (TPR) repeat protein
MAAEKKMKSEKTCFSNAPRISGKRLWLFRIIAVVAVPLLFFGFLELVLRLFNVGYETHAIIERKIDGRTMCCNNLKFGWRFFPPNIARDFPGFVFDAKKPPGTYRIFVLGSSAALGFPGPAYDFGRILEVMLNDSYPQTHFEVIVPAMVGINSHAVLEIARDCAKYDPDLFIVYVGNNEVLGPFGPGAEFSSISPNLFFIRAGLALKTTRTGQLFERIFSLWGRNAVPKQWDKMEIFLKRQVRYDSPQMELVYKYFEKNLNDICSAARRAGASIIFSNVGCNLKDCSPFSSLHKETLNQTDEQKWQEVYQLGIINETAGDYKQAINNYLAAEEIDDTFAGLHFRLGRCYRRTGEYETARKHYLKARQYDTLRFRADARINDVVRSVAQNRAKERIYFVDGVAALEKNSPHNTPGEELFYEHVHLNFTGNYVLAGAFFKRMQGLLPASTKQKQSAVLSKEQCAKRLVYTYLDYYQLLTRIKSIVEAPPFTNQLYHNKFMEKINKKIKLWRMYTKPPRFQAKLGQYESAIRERPDDWRLFWRYGILSYLSEDTGDLRTGDIQVRKSIELCPYNAIAYLVLGQSLHRQGNFSEALKVLYKLLELKPNSAYGHLEIAKVYRELKNYKKVIQHLSASMSIKTAMPDKGFYVILAEAYLLTGDTNKAIKTLYNAIKAFPERKMPLEHFYLGYLLGVKGEYKKALEESMLALKIDPKLANLDGFEECLRILKEKNNPGETSP